MPLADQLWEIWNRLKPHWETYFGDAGLRLNATSMPAFEAGLAAKIRINRQLPGLEDFSPAGVRGVEPGDPARSLLYHIFASPHTHPAGIKRACDYPTLEDLEIIENYIYSKAFPSLTALRAQAGSELAVVVFAYEYAPASDTIHKQHADLIFSRTGIGRVGDAPPHYEWKARGFFPHSGGDQVHVVPARFGAFLAVQRTGDPNTIGPLRSTEDDEKSKFWIPLHKLFGGTECLQGCDLKLCFSANHVNQKIKKVHLALQNEGVDTGWTVTDMQQPPFILTEGLAYFDSTCNLVIPVSHDPLVEPARTRERTLVGFPVPPHHDHLSTSLWFNQEGVTPRRWPEFVHVRHAIVVDKSGSRNVVYLPDYLGDQKTLNLEKFIDTGGYEAANFVDWTADGWVAVTCHGLDPHVTKHLAAYSILAQPDFFPLVRQQDLMQWWEKTPKEIKDRIWPDQSITPSPLSSNRSPANIMLRGASFDSQDATLTAIVGIAGVGRKFSGRKLPSVADPPRRESTLSYRATNLFEPGWDTSEDQNADRNSLDGVFHLAHYGLGSPYPEDTLICAAFGAFWPGAVPDVTRFFAADAYPSTTPILDQQQYWDGAPGGGTPLPAVNGGTARYKAFSYADYVHAIWQRAFRYGEFANVTFKEYIARTAATARVFKALGVTAPTDRNRYPILSFRNPAPEEIAMLKSLGWTDDPNLTYRIEIARVLPGTVATHFDDRTVESKLEPPRLFFASEDAIAFEDPAGSGQWRV